MDRPDLSSRQLYLVFTPELCPRDPMETLSAALEGGVQLVQWRCKRSDPLGLAEALARCSSHGVPLIVNDQVGLAVQAGAQGAHVGQDDLPAATARARMPAQMCLGVSTHSLAQLQQAVADGADHVGVGPCHPTATKGYLEGLPRTELRQMLEQCPVPAFAIGGITAARIPALRDLGVRHFAVAAAILRAADPRTATEELVAAIRA